MLYEAPSNVNTAIIKSEILFCINRNTTRGIGVPSGSRHSTNHQGDNHVQHRYLCYSFIQASQSSLS